MNKTFIFIILVVLLLWLTACEPAPKTIEETTLADQVTPASSEKITVTTGGIKQSEEEGKEILVDNRIILSIAEKTKSSFEK